MIPNAALQAHVSLELHPPSFRLMSQLDKAANGKWSTISVS